MAEKMTVTLSLSRKVNLGNYESGDVFMSINSVPIGASQDEIEAALDTGRIMFDVLRAEVNEKAKEIRNGGLK